MHNVHMGLLRSLRVAVVVDDNSTIVLRQKPFQVHAFWRRYCRNDGVLNRIIKWPSYRCHRLHRRDLRALLSVRLRLVPPQRVLAAGALRGLDWAHHIHRLHGSQRLCPPCVAGLAPRAPPTGLAAWPFPGGLRQIARRRPQGGVRVLRQPLGQVVDGTLQAREYSLQHGDSLFAGPGLVCPLL